MASKLCAVWLVVLIVLPFTAPFTTCERVTCAAISATYDDASIAAAPALQVDDDAIVTSERTAPVQRPGLCVVVADGGPANPIVRLAQRPPRVSSPEHLAVHARSSAILRV